MAHRSMSSTAAPVADRPPYDPALAAKMVTFFQGRVRMNPQRGAIEYAQLAHAYLQLSRQTGDPADYQLAQQAAQHSLAIRSKYNASASNALILSLFNQHQFRKAQTLAAASMAKYPDDDQGRLSFAESSMEIGDYTQAAEALTPRPDDAKNPSIIALQARLMEINGQPDASLAVLRRAQTIADANLDIARPSVAWFHMRVGDLLARIGRAGEAARAYEEALKIFPQDYKTMTGLTRLAAGRQDWPGAISWGQKAAEVMPNPEALALVGDAYAATHDTSEAQRQYQMVDAFSDPSQGILYDRQRALFLADHDRNLDEALTRARADMSVRHDIYAYDTLAWTLYKKGLLSEANNAITLALAHHTQDAMLFYHAGMIANARKDVAMAKTDLTRALAINPYFQPFAPADARKTLAGLENAH